MVVAIFAARWFARRDPLSSVRPASSPAGETSAGATDPTPAVAPPAASPAAELLPPGRLARLIVGLAVAALVAAVPYRLWRAAEEGTLDLGHAGITAALHWLVPLLMCAFLLFGFFRGVRVYEALTEGAQDGFNVALRIIPYMVAIFAAIAMLRASGALELVVRLVDPLTSRIGMPAEALPMVFLRPLSGTGAFAFFSEATARDPNGFVSYLLAIMQGSTETTFYVLAVYFGAVGVRNIRYAVTVGLLADGVGFAAALLFARLFY
jgi:spore maturation protein SpmB